MVVSFLAGFRKGRVVRLPYALHYTYGYRKVQGGKSGGHCGIVSFMDARHPSPRAALASFDAVCAEHFPDAPDWVIRSARRTIEARFYQC